MEDNNSIKAKLSNILLTPLQLSAIFIGVCYGILAQLSIRLHIFEGIYGVMSFGFVFGLPFVLGFLTISQATITQRQSWKFRIFAPIGTILLSLLFSVLFGWEGSICLIMAAVIYLPLASLGGIVSGIIFSLFDSRRIESSILVLFLSFPMLSAYVEHYFELPLEVKKVQTSIEINASTNAIWNNIIRVPLITEPLDGFFYKMGFPKPLEATLSYEGIGGVRNASFERGLLFIETVDVWEPQQKLSFSIVTHPDSVPPTTLDDHVVVGGRYFDVLRGTYQIEEISNNKSILHLYSEVRVSTRFNFYASYWARLLMSDIQNTILKVIKTRSEKV